MNALLPIYVAVVEGRSFSKAAESLGLSVSVVSRKIAKLERDLEVQLLIRNTRSLAITEAGQILYDYAVASIHELTLAKQRLKSLQNDTSGILKIGAPRSVMSCYIAPLLHQFVVQHPNIELHMMNGDYMLDLLRHDLDLAIHAGPLPDSSLYYQSLGFWSKETCASPAYLKKYGTPNKPSDLQKFICLDHLYNHNRTWRYHADGNNIWQPIHSTHRSDSSLDLKQLALSNLGIVYLPTFTVKNELESGALVSLMPDFQVPKLELFAVYPQAKCKTKKVQTFIDFLHEHLCK